MGIIHRHRTSKKRPDFGTAHACDSLRWFVPLRDDLDRAIAPDIVPGDLAEDL
jgi:hypothetical protein